MTRGVAEHGAGSCGVGSRMRGRGSRGSGMLEEGRGEGEGETGEGGWTRGACCSAAPAEAQWNCVL